MIWPFKKYHHQLLLIDSSVEKESPFALGVKACREGKELYDNPFVTSTSVIKNFVMWNAGWCSQKREASKI